MSDYPFPGGMAGRPWVARCPIPPADFPRAPDRPLLYSRTPEKPQGHVAGDQSVATTPTVSELDPLADLLSAAGGGDRRAFARLYKLSSPILFAVAMRMLRRREAAEEVVQEAYVAIWRKAGQYRLDRGQPMSWMIAIVRNRAIDRLRKRGREPDATANIDDLANVLPSGDGRPADTALAATSALRECMGQLKVTQQQAIYLAYYHGLTHEELAVRLDAPLGTVKSAVRRGLMQLRECLER